MLLWLVEVLCLVVAVIGLALLAGAPVALIVAGVLGVLACERAAARRPPTGGGDRP
ncbi:hypothetical protein [Goodfellowiella coeruleoviolacea]|uniref:Uncharacterized protein n=1 Tax=Goodfellowiella coeruleoviolacea TaxID=334858 RepID=A0AAE3KI56_9PSEU|nr:hypothetical protein [Goodfellowiella coeruleoviolacea]MCP2168125.1 hypothetical protein [Goodfellowiella coeruleoviolacea]